MDRRQCSFSSHLIRFQLVLFFKMVAALRHACAVPYVSSVRNVLIPYLSIMFRTSVQVAPVAVGEEVGHRDVEHLRGHLSFLQILTDILASWWVSCFGVSLRMTREYHPYSFHISYLASVLMLPIRVKK